MAIIPLLAPKQEIIVGVTVAERTTGSVITSAGLRIMTQAGLAGSLILTS